MQAERSGIIARMLRGSAGLRGYALLMHNLLPAYRALESGLTAHRHSRGVGRLYRPEVWRVGPLEADLAAMDVGGLHVLPEGEAYAARIAAAAADDGALLIAHAYTRTMGDLSGGQILHRLLAGSLALESAALGFYAFPEIADIAAYKTLYRAEIGAAGLEIADPAAVCDEACDGFHLTIALSEAIATLLPACVSES